MTEKNWVINDEVLAETNALFEGLGQTNFLEQLQKIAKYWTKCIELKGD